MIFLAEITKLFDTYLPFIPEELHFFIVVLGVMVLLGLGYWLLKWNILWIALLLATIPILLPWIKLALSYLDADTSLGY